MDKKRLTIILTLACALAAVVPLMGGPMSGLGQHTDNQPPPASSTHEAEVWSLTHPAGWTSEQWTGDDRPYQQIRATIDKALATGEEPNKVVSSYEAAARRQSNDPQAAFAWGYAAWKAIKFTTEDENHERLVGVSLSLATLPSPKSYEFTRLHFLTLARLTESPKLKGVGLRLVEHSPDDYSVKYQTIRILTVTFTPQDKLKALTYAQDLIRSDPSKADAYGLLGGVYLRSFDQDHKRNRSDGDKAVAAYQEYLKRAPATDFWRTQAQTLIESVRQLQAN